MDSTTEVPRQSFVMPIAAILCLSIGVYIVLVGIILLLRQWLLNRGSCKNCELCSKDSGCPCCCDCDNCCETYCNCVHVPDLEGCCDLICPPRRKTNCTDMIMCRGCDDVCSCCKSDEPLCDCGACNCQCQVPECTSINCCCFEIKLSPDA